VTAYENVTPLAFACNRALFHPNASWTSPLPTNPLPVLGSKVTVARAALAKATVAKAPIAAPRSERAESLSWKWHILSVFIINPPSDH
jgi:hypothetical protein